ncbi:hypothetical protein AB1I98_22800, partial [Enterococcus avium]
QTRRAGAYRGRPGNVWSIPPTAGGQGRALGSGSIPDASVCEKKYNQLAKVVGRLSIDRRLFNT